MNALDRSVSSAQRLLDLLPASALPALPRGGVRPEAAQRPDSVWRPLLRPATLPTPLAVVLP
ncbi:hypothetical protein [Deinococcus yunweiensis]|uniref:hypothetical protein n=1 Tax=Deinococcus yunweiensis TaxID=367282 RepID=UPI00398EC9AC